MDQAQQAALSSIKSGNLYGTTTEGGEGTVCYHSCGTVFRLTRGTGGSWSETVLYSFEGGTDGSSPAGSLTAGPVWQSFRYHFSSAVQLLRAVRCLSLRPARMDNGRKVYRGHLPEARTANPRCTEWPWGLLANSMQRQYAEVLSPTEL